MQTSTMKPLFMRERARHFLNDTVVHSMEGMLFAVLSTLFTLAGATAFLEDSNWSVGGIGMTASAPAQPASSAVAQRAPEQVARLQHASYVLPARP